MVGLWLLRESGGLLACSCRVVLVVVGVGWAGDGSGMWGWFVVVE